MQNVFPGADDRSEVTLPHEHAPATTLRDVLLLLRRRKWLIMLGTALGTGLATGLAATSEPHYTAAAALVIEPSQAPIAGMSSGAPSLSPDVRTISTQIDIIRSRRQMASVLDDLRLLEEPAFRATVDGLLTDRTSKLMELLAQAAAWLPEVFPPPTTAASALPAMLESETETGDTTPDPAIEAARASRLREAAIDAFNKRFEASQDGDSRVINIRFTATDPGLAASVVNRAAERYVEEQLKSKLAEAERVSLWLSKRISAMAEEVRSAEAAVETYRAEAGLTDEQSARSEQQELIELNRELGLAKGELLDRQSRLQMVGRARATGDTGALLGLVSSPILMSLREQELELLRQEAEMASSFGERHPRMQLLHTEKRRLAEKIAQEASRLALDIDREARRAQAHVSQLEQQIARYKAQNYARGGAEVGLRQLERQAEANRRLYELFLQHFKEIGEQQAMIEPDAQVISYANPPARPSSLDPKLFSLLGFTTSFIASALLALASEGLDRRVRSARQIERAAGLRVLGAVPRLRSSRSARPHHYLLERPISGYAEAMRSTYTALHFSGAGKPPKVVMVTSALAGEGKTTFAISLAATARQWGQRVLLVDADLRHPCVARITGGAAAAGLVEVLDEEAPLADAIRPCDGGFDVLGIARVGRNPTGLIGSRRMQALIDRLRSSYDLVVIDSPPVLAVTDARVTAPLADKTIFAVGWRQTPLSAVRRALRLLGESRADMAGTVLLRVDVRTYMYYENEDGANYYKKIKGYYVD